MKKETKNRGRAGQSLIEVMMAITMLTVGFLGISSLLSRSLALNRITTNEITATYLASEGIEIAKNLIDHDVYAYDAVPSEGLGWGSCFGFGTHKIELDYTKTDCTSFATYDPSHYLLYDPATHLYGYEEGSPTDFTRDIIVDQSPVTSDEIVVTSIVSWTGSAGAAGSINLEDHFYKWY